MFSDLSVARGVPVRRWTAAASFSLQAAIVAVALIYPLLRLQPLPPLPHALSLPVFAGVMPLRPVTTVPHGGDRGITAPIVVSSHTISFGRRSDPIQVGDPAAPPSIDLPSGDPSGNVSPIVGNYVPPIPTVPHHQTVRTSVMMEGNLIHKVEPTYPAMAKRLRIQGSVVIEAWISREGLIERAKVTSGHPLLVSAALDAVRQWRYRPYSLNHEPVEVETQITVNFVLQK